MESRQGAFGYGFRGLLSLIKMKAGMMNTDDKRGNAGCIPV